MCSITEIFSLDEVSLASIMAMTDLVTNGMLDDKGCFLFGSYSKENLSCFGRGTLPNRIGGTLSYLQARGIEVYTGSGVALAVGHRRLSIVDLSPLGHQPRSMPDRRFWIVQNGKICNFVELRQELEALGHRFITYSNPAVAPVAYVQCGVHCILHFTDAFYLYLHAGGFVGSCLFAALDFSSIFYVISELVQVKDASLRQSLSVCVEETHYVERKWIEEVTVDTGVQPNYVFSSLEMNEQQNEPFDSTNGYVQWIVPGLPDEFKASDGMAKRALRTGVTAVWPDAIREENGNIGFESLEEVWMLRKTAKLFEEKMKQAIQIGGIFNPSG